MNRWERSSSATPALSNRPEPIRPITVLGTWGYVTPIGVAPGEDVGVHVSVEGPHEIEIARLGRCAILDPAADRDAEHADREVVFRSRRDEAAVQLVRPGSYVGIGGPPIHGRPLTLSVWLRLWRLPVADTLSFAWAGLISDFDFPNACHFGLIVDFAGRVGVYAGDGGRFKDEHLFLTEQTLRARLGFWSHLAAVVGLEQVSISIDGHEALRAPHRCSAATTRCGRIRLGACAQSGVVDNLLDGDIAQPFVGRFELNEPDARRLAADRGQSSPVDVLQTPLLAHWPLDEERGQRVRDASGGERHGWIANHATWQIGGPACRDDAGGIGYEPLSDPSRGHALRFCADDLMDCGWPAAETVRVSEDAPSGLYAATIQPDGQNASDALVIPFVVSRTAPAQEGAAALVVPTFTWAAYARVPRDEVNVPGLASSFYTTHSNGRLFFHVGMRAPAPRLGPYVQQSHRAAHTEHSHLVRPELLAHAWLEREGFAHEVITDLDLHCDASSLERFATVIIVGHSEYWSQEMRDRLLDHLKAGGDVLNLSGNTLYWRVSVDEEEEVLECRKTLLGEDGYEDPPFLFPREWRERWHSDGRPGGTWTLIGEPGADVLGLESWSVSDMAVGYRPLTVLAPDHPLFHEPEQVPIVDGMIGLRSLNGSAASGFETDAVPPLGSSPAVDQRSPCILARAEGHAHVWVFSRLPGDRVWPREKSFGADVIWWEHPQGGRVFGLGSIAASGALPVDAGVAALVRNVLARFDVRRDG